MKRGASFGFLAMVAAGLAAGSAGAQPPPDADALVKRVQALEETNKALVQRLEELEKRLENRPEPAVQSLPANTAPPPAPENKKETLRSYWDNGLRFETDDGQFSLKVGGRIMFDAAHVGVPDYWSLGGPEIDEHDGTEFRRLRLRFAGDIYDSYVYKLEVDFADGDAEIIDSYVGMKDLPYVGTVRVGQFSEPFGLEALTSSSFVTFMERSMATQALIPYRSRGAIFNNAYFDQRLTVSAGVFNGGMDQDSYWSVTGRVTGLPWYADEGRRLLHLGLSVSRRNPESDYGFYARPGSHLANDHLNTGELPANAVTLWGAEAAMVWGPFSVQGEFIRADVSFKPEHRDVTFLGLDRSFRMRDRHFNGYYVQAGWFLTGEHRVYDPATGAFERVIPRGSFRLQGGGWGAWELAARYDMLSLDDYDVVGGVVGGEGRNVTVGVNWYMTPNVRLMLNYVRSDIDQFAYEGAIDIIEARFQTDF